MAEAMAKCSDELDIEAIIKEIMEERGVSPDDIPLEEPFDKKKFIRSLKKSKNWSKRYFFGHAKAKFKCDKGSCKRSWTSHHAGCILDLKEQKIKQKFKQKCKKHRKQPASEEFNGLQPRYRVKDKDSVREMVKWAVELCAALLKGEKKERKKATNKHSHTKEHKNYLCEVCGLFKRKCTR